LKWKKQEAGGFEPKKWEEKVLGGERRSGKSSGVKSKMKKERLKGRRKNLYQKEND